MGTAYPPISTETKPIKEQTRQTQQQRAAPSGRAGTSTTKREDALVADYRQVFSKKQITGKQASDRRRKQGFGEHNSNLVVKLLQCWQWSETLSFPSLTHDDRRHRTILQRIRIYQSPAVERQLGEGLPRRLRPQLLHEVE